MNLFAAQTFCSSDVKCNTIDGISFTFYKMHLLEKQNINRKEKQKENKKGKRTICRPGQGLAGPPQPLPHPLPPVHGGSRGGHPPARPRPRRRGDHPAARRQV